MAIPERAKEIAEQIARSIHRGAIPFSELSPTIEAAILSAIREARADEREACATLTDEAAEDASRAFRGLTPLNAAAYMEGRMRALSPAIRSRKDPT